MCDLDAFFASVEQRDNPAFKGRAVIVGGDPDSPGVVSTCSYEAENLLGKLKKGGSGIITAS